MVKFSKLLKERKFWARIFYLFPSIIFTIGMYNVIKNFDGNFNSFLLYNWIVIVPFLIFIYQFVRNSLIGWVLVDILYLAYWIMLIEPISEFKDWYGSKYDFDELIVFILMLLFYAGISIVLWLIRPRKRII